ncbi:MAG: hypothetical protein Q7R93_05515 [bacterium]|nr:hypothetical protein [bacterium]
MKELDKAEKVSILISALEERYEALRVIRSRAESIGLWSLGLLLSAGAWIIQSELIVNHFEKVLYLVGASLAFVVLRFNYLEDLARGFKGQQRAAARIEKALKLYEQNFFDESNESIYPKEWMHAGTNEGAGRFFQTTYNLLYIGFGFLIIAILSIKTYSLFFY